MAKDTTTLNEFYRVYVRRPGRKRFTACSSLSPLADAQATAERVARDLRGDVQIRQWKRKETK